MKTLTIKDLPVTEELDSRAMSAVRGGYAFLVPGFISMNGATLSMPFDPQQFIDQTQTTFNQNGSNIAFAEALSRSQRLRRRRTRRTSPTSISAWRAIWREEFGVARNESDAVQSASSSQQ